MISFASGQPQVLIAGGGPTGICAAIAAARNGARTLLIERYGYLGGTATLACMGPIAPFHFKDEQVIQGIPQEIIERLVKMGGATGHLKMVRSHGVGPYMCWYDREVYKYVALQMLQEAGADILLHTWVSEAIMEEDRIRGLIVQNKSGRQMILADMVIDATGDGDVMAAAGAGFHVGRDKDGLPMAMTLLFEMANVDLAAVRRYIETNPQEFDWWSPVLATRPIPSEFQQDHFAAQGFLSLIRNAIADGRLYLGLNSPIIVTGLRANTISFNATRITKKLGIDARDLSQAEMDGRRQVMSLAEFMKECVPGFSEAYVMATGTQIGVRETRRLAGTYVLTGEDVRSGRKFPDVIARGYFPIDIHDPSGTEGYKPGGSTWIDLEDSYDIPYRCCVPERVEGLLVGGRCISATHEAIGSVRSTGSCMALGQAVGTAAALAVQEGCLPRYVKLEGLQSRLKAQGASLHRVPGQVPGAPVRGD